MNQHEIDLKYLKYAYELAIKASTDPSTQNAALLVDFTDEPSGVRLLEDVTRLPYGVKDLPERAISPLKYEYYEHAERNVIYAAARQGTATSGLTMYAVWAACTDCARAIIQSGISTLVRHQCAGGEHPVWDESCRLADEQMLEAGIIIRTISDKIDPTNSLAIRRNGKLIYP